MTVALADRHFGSPLGLISGQLLSAPAPLRTIRGARPRPRLPAQRPHTQMQTVLDAHASLNPKPIAKLSEDHHCGRPDALHAGLLVR
jgi:hypothetical protein